MNIPHDREAIAVIYYRSSAKPDIRGAINTDILAFPQPMAARNSLPLLGLVVSATVSSTILFSSVSFAGTFIQTAFPDVAMGPSFEPIHTLRDIGILQGYPDGTFRPQEPINRAEFLKLVMHSSPALKPLTEGCSSTSFSDVIDSSQWYMGPICGAVEAGIVDGYSDGTFQPFTTINVRDAAKIVVNTYQLPQSSNVGNDWFTVYMNTLENYNSVPIGVIDTSDLLTREQMAQMVWSLQLGGDLERSDQPMLRSGLSCEALDAELLRANQREHLMTDWSNWLSLDDLNTSNWQYNAYDWNVNKAGFPNMALLDPDSDSTDYIQTSGGYVYVLLNNTVKVIDIRDPKNIRVVHTIDTTNLLSNSDEYLQGVHAFDDSLVVVSAAIPQFTSESDDQLLDHTPPVTHVRLYSLTDPTAPALIREYETVGYASDFRRIEDRLVFTVSWRPSITGPDSHFLPPSMTDSLTGTSSTKCSEVSVVQNGLNPTHTTIVNLPLNNSARSSSHTIFGADYDHSLTTDDYYYTWDTNATAVRLPHNSLDGTHTESP